MTAESGEISGHQHAGVRRAESHVAVPNAAVVVIVAACAIMLGLSFFALGRQSLWFDEGATIAYARLGWVDLAHAMTKSDIFFVLYYTLIHLWRLPFGESETALRALSALCGAGAVVAIAAVAWRLAGSRAAVIAAIITVVNPLGFNLAREARPYSLLLLFTALMALAFLGAERRPTLRNWSVFALTAAIAAYVHVFALLAVAAFVIWAALLRRDLFRTGLTLAVVATGIAVLPIIVIISTYDVNATNSWILPSGSPRAIITLLHSFAGSRASLVLAALVVAAAIWIARKRPVRIAEGRVAFVVSWLVVPIVLAYTVSLRKPVFVDKYLVEALPAFIIGIAIAVSTLPRVFAAGVVVVWVALAVPGIRASYANVVEGWRGAAQSVLSNELPSDGVAVFPAPGIIVFDYYARRLHMRRPTVVFPVQDAFPLDTRTDWLRGSLHSVTPSICRLWVILDPLRDDPEKEPISEHFRATIPARFVLAQRERFPRITVLRFDVSQETSSAGPCQRNTETKRAGDYSTNHAFLDVVPTPFGPAAPRARVLSRYGVKVKK